MADYHDYNVISKYSLNKLLSILRKHREEYDILKSKAPDGASAFIPTRQQFTALSYLTDDKTSHVGFGGGAGGAKTVLGCFWVISQALANPNTTWFIGRRTLVALKQTTLITFWDTVNLLKIPKKQYKYRVQDNEVHFSNGSKVFFKDMDWKPSDPHYTRFGGLELTCAFIDEANEVPEKAIEIISSRVGRRNSSGIHPTILYTFNPDKGFVYRRFYKPWVTGTLRKDTAYVPALAVDNPHLPDSYIETLWNLPKISKERLLFGNFEYDDKDSALVSYENIMAMFDIVPPIVSPSYLVVDVAGQGNDNTVIAVWRGDELIKIIVSNKSGIKKVVAMVNDTAVKYGIPNSNIIVDAIGIGEGVAQSALLSGCVPFKASNSPIAVEREPSAKYDVYGNKSLVPKYSAPAYKNIRSQLAWLLARKINNGEIAIRVPQSEVIKIKDKEYNMRDVIVEELALLQDANPYGDGKKMLIGKKDMRGVLGRSPDVLDTFIMRMYFELVKTFDKKTDVIDNDADEKQIAILKRNRGRRMLNSSI